MPVLVQSFEGEEIERWELSDKPLVIGRSGDANLFIEDPGVSRHHCKIEKQNENYIARDLSSANGTFINGQEINEKILNEGDIIKIGKYSMHFITEQGVQEQAPAEQKSSEDEQKQKKCSLLITNDEGTNTIVLNKSDYLIGKYEECDINVGGWGISGVHALLINDSVGVRLINASGKNIEIGGVPVKTRSPLSKGDTFKIGGSEMKLV